MRPRDCVEERLDGLARASLLRELPTLESMAKRAASESGIAVLCDARSNDYLGLGALPVSRGTTSGTVSAGAGASRLISGTTERHLLLEHELAEWLETEAALTFSSAYAANTGVISALAQKGDTVFSDALNHASIIEGCRASRAEVVVLPHLDVPALARALRQRKGRGQAWVVTETYFGMDGDSPELRALRAVCDEADAALIVDEAHALGVFGIEGRGLCAAARVVPDVLIGGFGKALGLQGGLVAAARPYIEWFWNRARSFVFSTATSPWLAETALERLRRVRAAEGERRQLENLSQRFEQRLRSGGVPLPAGRHGPLFPVVFGEATVALGAAETLRLRGFRVHAVRPPTVPPGSSRLRLTLRADMSAEGVEALAAAVVRVWHECSAETRGSAVALAPESVEAERADALEGAAPSARVAARSRSSSAALHLSEARRWVVFGTGTGVGKTHVAVGLVDCLSRRGEEVVGLKPIETGTAVAGQDTLDADKLSQVSFHVKQPMPHPLYAFDDPVTPSLAARRAGQAIDPALVAAWVDRARAADETPVHAVIETAGGVFSPLGPALDNYHLALALGPAHWVLVASNRLGVLHDVAATLRAMAALGRTPEWLILNASSEPDASSPTNLEELRAMGITLPILELPRHDVTPLSVLLGP